MSYITQRDRELFENFFVLELANNHWGRLERGLKIIRDHAAIVRYNNVKAAIKLQFRDVDEFIHPDFRGNTELRYIKKTEDTKLSRDDFARMVEEIAAIRKTSVATVKGQIKGLLAKLGLRRQADLVRLVSTAR